MTRDENINALRASILDLLAKRKPGVTICPSEAARAVAPDHWRDLMKATRQAAIALVEEGFISICQRGEGIDPSAGFKGPVRLRLERDWSAIGGIK